MARKKDARRSYETTQHRQSAFHDLRKESPMIRDKMLRRDSVDSRYERDSQNTSNYLVQTPFSNKNSKTKSGGHHQMGSHQMSKSDGDNG